MSQDFVDFLIEKLSKSIEDNALAPYKDKLVSIQVMLKTLKVPQVISPETTSPMDDLSDWWSELDDTLQDCQAQTKKREKGILNFTITDLCSPIKSNSLYTRLEKLEDQLVSFRRELSASVSDQPKAEEETREGSAERPYEWTTSFIDETRIIGWDDDVKKIVEPLIECKTFSAIAIVGMYGSGKTALAQKIYTHEKVKDNFPLRLWVCVSPSCTPEELIYRMLDNLGREQEDVQKIIGGQPKIGELLYLLYLELLGKKYLIMFDDVWDTDDWHRDLTSEPPEDGVWDARLAYGLPKGNGSAVIATCRREDDARIMVETGHIYRPKQLNEDDGWTLFMRAYNETEGTHDDIDVEKWSKMKKAIVDKCGGHPLALIAAGQRLAREKKLN